MDGDNEDALLDAANNYDDLICDRPERARFASSIVGPLRYGINTFRKFHPSVIPFMDPDAFGMRFDWHSCGATQRNAMPRWHAPRRLPGIEEPRQR